MRRKAQRVAAKSVIVEFVGPMSKNAIPATTFKIKAVKLFFTDIPNFLSGTGEVNSTL